ncbi:MAG: ABC transporter permease [Tepidisphaeraceae bacterium]
MKNTHWLAVRKPLAAQRAVVLKAIAFCVPLLLWCAVSYVPWIWHPQRLILDAGGSDNYAAGQRVDRSYFDAEQDALRKTGDPLMVGRPANPVFLPAPHEVAQAMVKAFGPPDRKGTPWLYERILHSIQILFYGFILATAVAIPLGVLCGTFDFFAKLIEPFVDFMRYMPAPAFGALMVAIFSLNDAPKVAIIFIGLFFNMLLVTANTTRGLEVSLLEAAQTLGANRRKLIRHVVIPGTLPLLYTDMRIALGFGWVYLTIAELIGEMSGITEFINQQGKFRNYPNVFVGIIVLGMLGFITDQFLGWLGNVLFPWHSRRKMGWVRQFIRRLRANRIHSGFESATPHVEVSSVDG